ncbi:MAG: phosphoribosylanthranilate isomerase [Nitrososphaerales archaeon]|nr:phosphoribosylanthranilate isomerase [Nitrososphaerales archaeon]
MKVKICGITQDEDVRMVCELGADAIGFVVGVPSSPRNLSVERAKSLFKLVSTHIKRVLVTVPQRSGEVLKFYEYLKPDAIQIHGEEIEDLHELKKELSEVILIRALSMKSKDTILRVAIQEAKSFDAILVDSFAFGKYGGSGKIHDWSISKRIRDAIYPKPLILAGGLTPENVREAIQTVMPYAVDVSTGVELRPGVKDYQKVKSFINNAKGVVLNGYSNYPELW